MLTPRNNRHANVPITPELLENIFITRLDMTLKPHHTVKAAYQNKPNWYPKHHHFTIANGNLAADIAQLTQFLSAEVRRVWRVNSVLVTDETIFKWEGSCSEVAEVHPQKTTSEWVPLVRNVWMDIC